MEIMYILDRKILDMLNSKSDNKEERELKHEALQNHAKEYIKLIQDKIELIQGGILDYFEESNEELLVYEVYNYFCPNSEMNYDLFYYAFIIPLAKKGMIKISNKGKVTRLDEINYKCYPYSNLEYTSEEMLEILK